MTQLGRAVVVGGGMGGLAAAAALAPNASQVTVFDRDELIPEPVVRKAAPQGAHIHILLQAGINHLEVLLPGFREDLITAGSAQIRAGTGQQIFSFGEWYPERDLGFTFLGQSRAHLESQLVRRVSALPNVELRPRHRVQLVVADGGRVRGVLLGDGESEELVAADLVVDASGVGARLSRLLTDAVSLVVPCQEHRTDVFYSTVHFRKPGEFLGKKENILILPDPEGRRGGSLIDIENETWCVSLHGRSAVDHPNDMEKWLEFARTLPSPRVYERVRKAEPVAAPLTFRKAKSTFRRFDQIQADLPVGYFPVGDVFSSFNPIFGQGMTVALAHAVSLGQALLAAGTGSGTPWLAEARRHYFAGATAWSERAWRMTVSHDLAHSAQTDTQRRQAAALEALAKNRQARAKHDPEVHRQIVAASQMLDLREA